MKNPYTTLRSKIVHHNPYWTVVDNTVMKLDGTKGQYYVVEKCDVAVTIPLTTDGAYTYLVRQWRYPVKQLSWEFSMGGLQKNETSLAAAKRELLEETGITAKCWHKLKPTPRVSNGTSTERIHIFIASDITFTGKTYRDDWEENMLVKRYALKDVYAMAKKGSITDGLTISALFYLQDYL